MIYLCMYVVFDISKRSLSVYVASLLGPHYQTVIFPRAESLDMQELNTMVSGLVLHRTKGELGPQLGPELLKLTKQVVETHHIQLSQVNGRCMTCSSLWPGESVCLCVARKIRCF